MCSRSVRSCSFGLGVLASAIIAGCATSGGASSAWIARAGGVIHDARQNRIDAVAARVVAGDPRLHVKVQVLATDAVCAFAWPNGHIYVTRGFVERADDDLLAAALAHEIGHLLADGRVRSIASVRGCDKDADAEVRADANVIALLREENIPGDSMIRMLRLVRDSNALTPECRRAMDHRIELLASPQTRLQN